MLRANVLFSDILQSQICVKHQDLRWSVELPVDEPVLVKIMQIFQVFERNARFFVASSFLNPLVGDLWAGTQVHNQVTLDLVLFVDELVPLLQDILKDRNYEIMNVINTAQLTVHPLMKHSI